MRKHCQNDRVSKLKTKRCDEQKLFRAPITLQNIKLKTIIYLIFTAIQWIIIINIELFKQHENIKKTAYNRRVIEVEHGSFTPLVFSTCGGMGSEAFNFHKRLAERISVKRNEAYDDVITYIRRKLRFSILRTSLIAVRGTRKPFKKIRRMNFSELDFGTDSIIY